MEKDKRKKALQVACTVFVFVCVIFAMYKLTKLDEKNAIQRQKQEETQEKEDKINAKCEAIEYMDEYTENLCIWHIPTAGFAEQNGRNAKLNGRLPFDY